MLFEPYQLWQEPSIVAYQRDDPKRLASLLAHLPPGTELLYHCPGHDGRQFFAHLERLQPTVPHVRFHLVANSLRELGEYKEAFSLPVTYGPVTLFTWEGTFNLEEHAERDKDAIYVARFEPSQREHVKRLPLARRIASLRVVTFSLRQRQYFREAFYKTFPELSHAEVNDVVLSPEQVAGAFNRSRVNLALSPHEGCMRAFTEGLLCGVPAVSTRCRSARSEFFHHHYVSICADDADAVARAVAQAAERAAHPEEIRAFALTRLQEMRGAYTDYVAKLAGASPTAVYDRLFRHPHGPHRLAFPEPGVREEASASAGAAAFRRGKPLPGAPEPERALRPPAIRVRARWR